MVTGLWLVSAVAFFTPDLEGPGIALPGADKAVHLVMFAALTAAAAWCFGVRPVVVAAVLAYALAVEAVQGLLVDGRSASLLDLVADGIGITLALWTSARLRTGRGQ